MKILRVISLILISLFFSCNFYGDLNLGSDFYYQTDPTFNSIVTPDNKDKPYSIQSSVIRDIDSLGYNERYILATSNRNDSIFYWIIDKNKQSIELGYDIYSNLKLSNVMTVDSFHFYKLEKEEQIEMKSKLYYQKEAGWR